MAELQARLESAGGLTFELPIGRQTEKGGLFSLVHKDLTLFSMWTCKGMLKWFGGSRTHGGIWGIPSPDGRYLAFPVVFWTSNAWLIEGF